MGIMPRASVDYDRDETELRWIFCIIKSLKDALVARYILSPSLSIMTSLVTYFVDNGTGNGA